MSTSSAPGMQPLFVVNDVVVTNIAVDTGVGGVRARLGRAADGAAVLVEDLAPRCLEDDDEVLRFCAELAMRGDFGTRALAAGTVRGSVAPVGLTRFVPGVPFERVFRALNANGGTAPAGVVVAVARAVVPALQAFAGAPIGPDDIAMLAWATFDGALLPVPRVARVSPRTEYGAPERSAHGAYGAPAPGERALVFSLGILLRHLYFGLQPRDVVDRGQPAPDAALASTELGKLILACTERRPAARPATLDEVARRIAPLGDGDDELGFVAQLFAPDRRELEALVDELGALDVDASRWVPLLATRALPLHDVRRWLRGASRPRVSTTRAALP